MASLRLDAPVNDLRNSFTSSLFEALNLYCARTVNLTKFESILKKKLRKKNEILKLWNYMNFKFNFILTSFVEYFVIFYTSVILKILIIVIWKPLFSNFQDYFYSIASQKYLKRNFSTVVWSLPSEVKNNDSKFHFIQNCPSVEIAFAVYLY